MTALATVEARVTLTNRIDAWRTEGQAIADDLALAGYPNPHRLSTDRGWFKFAVNVGSNVMASLGDLGTDPEARD